MAPKQECQLRIHFCPILFDRTLSTLHIWGISDFAHSCNRVVANKQPACRSSSQPANIGTKKPQCSNQFTQVLHIRDYYGGGNGAV